MIDYLDTVQHMDALDLLRSLPDASVDMIFTDPPYGHNNNNGDLIQRRELALGKEKAVRESRPILNDGPEANDLFYRFLGEAQRVLKPGACCCCCCCGGGGPDPQFARWTLWMDEVIGFKQAVVWDKGPMGMGWHYRRSYEFVLVAQKPGAACKWYDVTRAIENIIRPGNGASKQIPAESDHPTKKPVGLAMWFIRLHSQPGDIVCDPFAGGGSTLKAARLLGRRFIGADLDLYWVDYTRRELQQPYTPPLFDLDAPAPPAAAQLPLMGEGDAP